jgi:hypothetical protein
MIVLFVVCSGEESGDSTTTSGVSSTTSLAQTTTTPPPETTTSSVAETTTTVAETTTTVDDGLLEGNWAPEPLIVASFGALGWFDGAGWIQVTEGTALPVAGGEDYQVALFGVDAITTGGAEELVCDPLLNTGVVLDEPGLLGGDGEPYGVAISAPWALAPHNVEAAEDDGTYAAVAAELLAERGLDVPEPIIKQVFKVDLEGDGVNEVLVVAEDVPPSLLGEPGDYSIAFMQRVVGGEVTTIVFGDSVLLETTEGEIPLVISFAVADIADLNGDQLMEVVLDSTYYEGSAVEVWEYVGDDVGLQQQISVGCGV